MSRDFIQNRILIKIHVISTAHSSMIAEEKSVKMQDATPE